MTIAIEPVATGNEADPVGSRPERRARSDVFSPRAGGLAARIGAAWSAHDSRLAALVVIAYAYVVFAVVTVGIGLVLAAMSAQTAFDVREQSVIRWLADARTPTWNTVTAVGSNLANTPTVVLVAGIAVLALVLTKHYPAALFLAAGLVLEVSVFVTAAFLVNRDRPDVVHLDHAPPTSSYPSGHTAAAVVLYVGLALVLVSLTRLVVVRITAFVAASGIVVFVGTSRMYRGMHHPSDVIAGALLGAACLVAALVAVRAAGRVVEEHAQREEATS